jgi:hypothetical protein
VIGLGPHNLYRVCYSLHGKEFGLAAWVALANA